MRMITVYTPMASIIRRIHYGCQNRGDMVSFPSYFSRNVMWASSSAARGIYAEKNNSTSALSKLTTVLMS